MGIDLQTLRQQIQPALKLKWATRSGVGQQIPAVHVFNIQSAIDVEIRQRPAEMRSRRNQAVHADVTPVDQADDVGHGAVVETEIDVQLSCRGLRLAPLACRRKTAEPASTPVCSRRFSGKPHTPGSSGNRRRRYVEIGIYEIKDRFCVPELEIHAARSYIKRRQACELCPVEQLRKIPYCART